MASAVLSDRYIRKPSRPEVPKPWHEVALEELADLEYLPLNWDGEQSQRPPRETIFSVISFIEFLKVFEKKQGNPLPELTVAPIRTGGILLEWNTTDFRLDVEFYGAHEAQFAFLNRKRDLHQVKGKLIRGQRLPDEFLECLRSFVGCSAVQFAQ